MNVARTARDRARADITAAVKESARRQVAEAGAASLSLRAVARDLGMVSSAIYRYFAGRDELLTALIVDAYDALGAVAERTDAAARDRGDDPGARLLGVCRAVRGWALAHPHEYALVYGSPVPGYLAPPTTVEPASRVGRVLLGTVVDARRAGALIAPARPLPADGLVASVMTDLVPDGAADPLPGDLALRALGLRTMLIGTVSLELFGHLHRVVDDPDRYFDATMVLAAESVGYALALPDPPDPPDPPGARIRPTMPVS